MSKKKSGAKKSQRPRPSQRPSAPPLSLAPPSSSAPSVRAQPSEPPAAPDTFAPTSSPPATGSDVGDRLVARASEDEASASASSPVLAPVLETVTETPETAAPEATPPGISVDVVPERASARKLAIDDEADRAFFEGASAAEARLHAEVVKQIAHEEATVHAPIRRITPEVIARRDKMKRVVTGVVAVAGVLSLGVFTKMALGPKQHAFDESAVRAHAAKRVEAAPALLATHDPPRGPRVDAPPPPPADDREDEATADPAAPGASAAPSAAAASAAPSAASSPSEATGAPGTAPSAASSVAGDTSSAVPDPDKAKPLTKKALQALEGGKYAAAIEHASASVDADPTDANAYLYWGTALMEQGKRAEAKAVFARCVASSKRGPKHECASFAR